MKSLVKKVLYHLARSVLLKYSPDVVGITGSVGKTSAKEAIACALQGTYRIGKSEKNFNNELGVPLTILRCTQSPSQSMIGWLRVLARGMRLLIKRDASYPSVLILEMGADKPGDIAYLTRLAPCTIGVVTCIAPAHLEGFGSMERLEREKKILHLHLDDDAKVAVVNADDPVLFPVREKMRARVLSYGFHADANVHATMVREQLRFSSDIPFVGGARFNVRVGTEEVSVTLAHAIGKQHVYAALAGFAVGHVYRIPFTVLRERIETYQPPLGRMRLLGGIKQTLLIDDTYNSSPFALEAAVDELCHIGVEEGARRIAVLGDMLELGQQTERLHREAGISCAQRDIDIFLFVGSFSRWMREEAIKIGIDESRALWFDRAEQAGLALQSILKRGDIVLVKGSQGMRLERVVKEVMARPERAHELLVRQGKEWQP